MRDRKYYIIHDLACYLMAVSWLVIGQRTAQGEGPPGKTTLTDPTIRFTIPVKPYGAGTLRDVRTKVKMIHVL